MATKVTDAERERIIADIKTGELSRNAIADKHDRSVGTITNIATKAGLTDAFDRSATENATRAAQADNARSRAELSARFLAEAHNALDDLHEPHLAHSFGGRDNSYNEHVLPKPPPAEKRNLMIIAATASDKHMALERHDTESDGLAAVDAWLRAIAPQGTPE